MQWKSELRQLLKTEFENIKSINPNFSLRSYAKKLKISPGALSQIIAGNYSWKLTTERAAEMVELLDISQAKKLRMLTLIGVQPLREWDEISLDEYEFLCDSTVTSIICCHELPAAERAPEKISQRLGVPQQDIEKVIEILISKGHLIKNEALGVVETAPQFFRVSEKPEHEAVREFHKKNMKLAAHVVETVPTEDIRYSSLTFVGGREQLDLVKKEFQAFNERLMNLMNVEDKNNEVFRLSTCLFPMRDITSVAK